MEEAVQGSLEWLRDRAGHVTAGRTEDVKAFGKDGKTELAARKNYKMRIVTERLKQEPVMDGFVSAEMQRGIDLEPVARARYEAETGNMVDQRGFVKHPTIKWFGASPDGVIGDDGLVEIKCPNTLTHIGYLIEGKPPAKYHDQMIAQCMCLGKKWVDFVSFDDRLPDHLQLFIVRFTPTQKDFDTTEAAVIKFLAEVEVMYEKIASIPTNRSAIQSIKKEV
jgi:hypothetical protein